MPTQQEKTYDFAVWATQGGGLAREANGAMVFITKPDCPGLDVGDLVPNEWDYQPWNGLAQKAMALEAGRSKRGGW